MRVLLNRIRTLGGAKEIHVRVACPKDAVGCTGQIGILDPTFCFGQAG